MTAPSLPGLPERYRIGETLGAGGFGRVYRAHDQVLDRPVAVKVLKEPARDAASRRRFRREAQVTARIRHPHVVGVFDNGLLADGSPYMVYEFVPGRSLEEATRDEAGPLSMVATALAEALAAVHGAGAVHRDVKPGNVLLRRPGDPVLLDLGIVRLEEETTPFTPEGILLGTPAYMAPELFAGGPATPASDQFAWAATLVHAAGGQVYRGTELREVLSDLKHLRPRDRMPPGLPGDLRVPLIRALDPDPEARYPRMELVAQDLRERAAAARSQLRTISSAPTAPQGRARAASGELDVTPLHGTARRPGETARHRVIGSAARFAVLGGVGLLAMVVGYLLQGGALPGRAAPGPAVSAAPRPPPASLEAELAGLLPPPVPAVLPDTEEPTRGELEELYDRAMSEDYLRETSRALQRVERWLRGLPPEQHRAPDGAYWMELHLAPLALHLDALHRIENRTRSAPGLGGMLIPDRRFLEGWDRDGVRRRFELVRAMVDSWLCRMEEGPALSSTLYPGLVSTLALPFDLLHGRPEAVACEASQVRGARAFRILAETLPRVDRDGLPALAHQIRRLTRVDTNFRALSSDERAATLDRLEAAILTRTSGTVRSSQLLKLLVRRGGLLRDTPTRAEDGDPDRVPERRFREALAGLELLVQEAPEKLAELPEQVEAESAGSIGLPQPYRRFQAAVRARVAEMQAP